jgi:hypothetical protein
MGHHPIKCISSSLERENVRCVFKLNSAKAAAETWHLEGHALKVNDAVSCSCYALLNERVSSV